MYCTYKSLRWIQSGTVTQIIQKKVWHKEKLLELRDQLDDLLTTSADVDNANNYVPC